jgi:hydroxymethylpyrimidine pyrophosphatase-like HAD family hydrolase
MPKAASKANAVLKLKELGHYDRIFSYGDAINDIPMFPISDECYAVENAVPTLKRMATGVIASNNRDGVAKWLLKNCLPELRE